MKKYLIILLFFCLSSLQAATLCLNHHLSPKSFFASEEAEAVLLTQNLKSPEKEVAQIFAAAIKKYEILYGSDFSIKDILAVSTTSSESFVLVTSDKVFKFPVLDENSIKWPKIINKHMLILEDSSIQEFILPFKIIQDVDLTKINLSDPRINLSTLGNNFGTDVPIENLNIYQNSAPIIIQDFNNNILEDYIIAHPEKKELIHNTLLTFVNSLLEKGYYFVDHNPGNLVYEETPEGFKILIRDIGAIKKMDENEKEDRIGNKGVFSVLEQWKIQDFESLKNQSKILYYLDKYIEQLQKKDPYDTLKTPILQAA